MNTKLILALIIIVLIIGGMIYFTNREPASDNNVLSEEVNSSGFRGEILAGTNSPFVEFNKIDYDEALESDKLVLLYFYANWCPTCKEELASALHPAFNELETDEVIGFRVNYKDLKTDKYERELASEFGIAYQHAKIFLRNGERVGKWPDSWSKERYIEEINTLFEQ